MEILYPNIRKTNNFHISPMLPLYRNQLIDFHCKSISQCLLNGNTELVKLNSWRSCWFFKVRPWQKPFQVDTQPKLNILNTFIWRPGRQINVLLHCYRDFHFSKTVLSLVMGCFKIIFLEKKFNLWYSDWMRVVFCMLINIAGFHYFLVKCQQIHF